MKAQNIEELKILVERYEAITLEEVTEEWNESDITAKYRSHDVARLLTGFGATGSCTLCVAVKGICRCCVYGDDYGCFDDKNVKTYNMIDNAETAEELWNGYRKRAKHLRKRYLSK